MSVAAAVSSLSVIWKMFSRGKCDITSLSGSSRLGEMTDLKAPSVRRRLSVRSVLQEEERKPELCCQGRCEGKAGADHHAHQPEGKRCVFIVAANQRGGQSPGFKFQVQQEELIKFQRETSGNLWSGGTIWCGQHGR